MGTKRREQPVRVAIIGGGCAAMAAAFELSRRIHRGRYAVTVYQLGWRLGGKGASGRGPAGRIEEHGLHLWLGFYENAFRVMRECYAELGRDPERCPIATWTDAFSPAPDVAVTERTHNGGFEAWIGHFPPGKGMPGDAFEKNDPFTVRGYLLRAASLLLELLESAKLREPEEPRENARTVDPERWVEAAETLLRYGQLATAAAAFQATDILRSALSVVLPGSQSSEGLILRLIEAISGVGRRALERLVEADRELARVWLVVDLVIAIMRGSLRFGLAVHPRGFDAINDYDWREWLRMNGASAASLDSGFVRGIYDLVFAYEGGDVERPALAAGVALRGAMRMFFTYRGAFFWRMNAGMGDIVFAPMYEVLRARGVEFEFFHCLRNVCVSRAAGEAPHISALDFDVQAKTNGPYSPLVRVQGLPCWPSRPDFSQLVEGPKLEQEGWEFEAAWEKRCEATKRLQVSRDFDAVVLATGIGALPYVAKELIEHSPRYRAMVEHVKTVPTQAFQVWMSEDMAALGWPHGPVNLSGFVEPFDTWADMGHLIPREAWCTPPKSVAYFCSVLDDRGGVLDEVRYARERDRVREHAVRFLERDVGHLWPRATNGRGNFRWDILEEDPPNGGGSAGSRPSRSSTGAERFDSQFWTANINPSDRYTLSLPGSLKYRISPLDATFDNLTIAGDWTQSGLDSGCVESAVMSGLLAAHAISGSPALETIVGYDHP